MIAVLALCTTLGILAAAGGRRAQLAWQSGLLKEMAREALGHVVPPRGFSLGAIERRVFKLMLAQVFISSSGQVCVPPGFDVEVSSDDWDTIDGVRSFLGTSLAALLAGHSERNGWKAPRDIAVRFSVQPRLRNGWPKVRATHSPSSLPESVGTAADRAGAPVPPVPPVPPAMPEGVIPATVAMVRASLVSLDPGDHLSIAVSSQDRGIEVGRDHQPDLATDMTVSGTHCRLTNRGDQWLLTDAGSRNGTFVDGTPITSIVLSGGELVRLGATGPRYLFTPSTVTRAASGRGPAHPTTVTLGKAGTWTE